MATTLLGAVSAHAGTSTLAHGGRSCVPLAGDYSSMRYVRNSIENTSTGASQQQKVVLCSLKSEKPNGRWTHITVQFRKWSQSQYAWCYLNSTDGRGRYFNSHYQQTTTTATGYPRLRFFNPSAQRGQALGLLCGIPGNDTTRGSRSALIDILTVEID